VRLHPRGRASALLEREDVPNELASGERGVAKAVRASLATAFMTDYAETLDFPSRNSSADSQFQVPVAKPEQSPALDRRVDAAALVETLRSNPAIQHSAFPSNRLHPPTPSIENESTDALGGWASCIWA
jgi:hypothetical protein